MLLAVVVTTLPVAAGVVVLDDDAPPAPEEEQPSYASTPLAGYDTSVVALSRAPFCDRLPDEAVAQALGDDDIGPTTAYGSGQSTELAPGFEDIAHEYGCRIEGRRGAEVRAWLFAPPVSRSRATDLVDEATGRESCSRAPTAPAYGAPSIALVCPAGDRRWASFRGLFGDAWLVCSLAAPASLSEDDLLDRAGRWCVAVAEAAAVG